MMKAAAIILSGGKSSRMGTNKALLKINEKSNIERIRDELAGQFSDILLVTNDPETYDFLGLKMASDYYTGKGPLAGIHAGLEASPYDVNVVVACDMPFISGELAKYLAESCSGYDAVIPVIDGVQNPLFAAYDKKVAAIAAQKIENGRLAIKAMLDELNVLYLSKEQLAKFCEQSLDRTFFNMNQPEEYENAKKWAEEK
jgi:molybdenum cofactor guanylyltransferase